MFVTFVWMDQALMQVEQQTTDQVYAYFHASTTQSAQLTEEWAVVEQQLERLHSSSVTTMLVAAALFALAAAMLLMNFSYLSKWARESEAALDVTRNIIYTDPLTGLPSMTKFHELSREGVADIVAQGAKPVAVAMNLAGLSDYNAKYGRDGGDRLLCSFADVLQKNFGEGACARFAEDRFYAYATEDEVARKLDDVFADFEALGEGKSLPVRAGVYLCGEEDDIAAVGFDRARAACDLDRKTWQSHVTWFIDGMSDDSRMRLHVLDTVDRAIAERWIRPYYQPIMSLATGKLGAEEALARWIDPEFGFLSPGQFIPILEEAGLLHKVDMHMVECVLQDLKAKQEANVVTVPVSVNISLRDVGQRDVAGEIVAKAAEYGVSPDLLRIEFTESAASEDPTELEQAIELLHGAGFQAWMDDFGSGFSSLNSLKNFQFDLVKLDMDFLRDERGERTWDVIEGVVQITERLGMRTLIEGVETEAQAQRIKEVGFDLLQGFYYAKPMPLEDAIKFREEG